MFAKEPFVFAIYWAAPYIGSSYGCGIVVDADGWLAEGRLELQK